MKYYFTITSLFIFTFVLPVLLFLFKNNREELLVDMSSVEEINQSAVFSSQTNENLASEIQEPLPSNQNTLESPKTNVENEPKKTPEQKQDFVEKPLTQTPPKNDTITKTNSILVTTPITVEKNNEPETDLSAYKQTMTSVFWVGEQADRSNDFIANDDSYWDNEWKENFGGLDDPTNRCGYKPCAFEPKENPFYFALPYGDLNSNGELKASTISVPWYNQYKSKESVLKNRWIEIKYSANTCYAQWEDVGPNEMDDYDYVFGGSNPVNIFGIRAGLDISPAVRDCLGLKTNEITAWRFVRDNEVPSGPWKNIVTNSDINFID